MGVVKRREQRVRRQCIGILPVEFDQRLDQVAGLGLGRGEIISLEFMPARDVGKHRLQEEGKYRRDDRKQ